MVKEYLKAVCLWTLNDKKMPLSNFHKGVNKNEFMCKLCWTSAWEREQRVCPHLVFMMLLVLCDIKHAFIEKLWKTGNVLPLDSKVTWGNENSQMCSVCYLWKSRSAYVDSYTSLSVSSRAGVDTLLMTRTHGIERQRERDSPLVILDGNHIRIKIA